MRYITHTIAKYGIMVLAICPRLRPRCGVSYFATIFRQACLPSFGSVEGITIRSFLSLGSVERLLIFKSPLICLLTAADARGFSTNPLIAFGFLSRLFADIHQFPAIAVPPLSSSGIAAPARGICDTSAVLSTRESSHATAPRGLRPRPLEQPLECPEAPKTPI